MRPVNYSETVMKAKRLAAYRGLVKAPRRSWISRLWTWLTTPIA